jgi:putative tryptophan/tyrosine transport system substrate-binding protein
MKRRAFITLLGSAAAAWPLAARAQQGGGMRRIGVLINRPAEDRESQAGVAAFQQVLQQLGWIDGRNLRIDIRWGESDAERHRKYAAELVELAPDIILASGTPSVAALQQATRTLPIVFVSVVDPVGAGVVDTLARPGGNTTGFMLFEYSLSGKWLELLKQIAPRLTQVAVLRDRVNPSGLAEFGVIQAVAQSLRVEVSAVIVRDAGEIERAVTAFARSANGGLIVTGSAAASARHDLIIALAARHKLPAVYTQRSDVTGGGLMFYGPDRVDQFRRAADYVDRILKGEKPADLPVQAPTKYELVINLKTAKALGLEVPATLLAHGRRGDRVKRREFITLFGGAAVAWPLAARAQQPAMPVIGFLRSTSIERSAHLVTAFRQGLKEAGYFEGENVAIEYRWADNQLDRLPVLAAELVQRRVAVIATAGPPAVFVAKAATTTIPTVFLVGDDPVKLGLVTSLARPGGNLTGINFFSGELTAKRLELLRELVPGAARIAVLVNPANAANAETTVKDVEVAARIMGLQIQIFKASTRNEINAAFASLVRERHDALFVGVDSFFTSRRVQLANLASRHAVPTTFSAREIAEAGGLMSYGPSIADVWLQVGAYTGRILKGAKPADLPVVQSSKFELVINAQTAAMLGLTVPPTLLSVADEVIE